MSPAPQQQTVKTIKQNLSFLELLRNTVDLYLPVIYHSAWHSLKSFAKLVEHWAFSRLICCPASFQLRLGNYIPVHVVMTCCMYHSPLSWVSWRRMGYESSGIQSALVSSSSSQTLLKYLFFWWYAGYWAEHCSVTRGNWEKKAWMTDGVWSVSSDGMVGETLQFYFSLGDSQNVLVIRGPFRSTEYSGGSDS